MAGVLETCSWVEGQAEHARVNEQGVAALVAGLSQEEPARITAPAAFDQGVHICDTSRPELTAQYLLVVDALNFCFWQDPQLEYADLAGGIKASVLRDPSAISAERLAAMTGEALQALVGWPWPLPLQEERARLLREVGAGLLAGYGGQAAQLVAAAGQSALRLVQLATAAFPGFRDHAIYRGRQVFFYKRAQIFCGDLWGAFQGKGLGCFHDIDQLTMFADYRVPVVLRELGVLQYSAQLAEKVDSRQELAPCSAEEIEIRAATVAAVEALRQGLATKFGAEEVAELPNAVQLDWWLWEQGERARRAHRPHHRTLTIYY